MFRDAKLLNFHLMHNAPSRIRNSLHISDISVGDVYEKSFRTLTTEFSPKYYLDSGAYD